MLHAADLVYHACGSQKRAIVCRASVSIWKHDITFYFVLRNKQSYNFPFRCFDLPVYFRIYIEMYNNAYEYFVLISPELKVLVSAVFITLWPSSVRPSVKFLL